MIFEVLYLTIGTLLEWLISNIFLNDFSLKQPLFICSLGIVCLVFLCKEKNYFGAIKLSFLYGFIVGLFYPYTIWGYCVVYTIVVLIMKYWLSGLSDSFLELFLIALLSVFLKEVLLYAYLKINNLVTFSLLFWTQKVLFYTIVGNLIFSFIPIILYRSQKQAQEDLNESKEKKERLFWFTYKSKEEEN